MRQGRIYITGEINYVDLGTAKSSPDKVYRGSRQPPSTGCMAVRNALTVECGNDDLPVNIPTNAKVDFLGKRACFSSCC
jgi:hypothetical protein